MMSDGEREAMPPEESLPPLAGPLRAPAQEIENWQHLHRETYTQTWETLFHLVGTVPMFPHPHWVAVHLTADPRYRCEGRLRVGESHCYFCYTLDGEGVFTDPRGRHRITAGRGFLMEINDPEAAYFYPPDARTPWRFLAFIFEGLAAQVMVRALTARHGAYYTLDPQTPALRRLIACGPHGHGGKTVNLSVGEAAALVMDLLTALADAAEAAEELDAQAALVRRASRVIGVRAVDGLRVAELAAELGVSREHLARVFQRQLQQSPGQVIRAHKMRHARFLLGETDQPVQQVAAALGYPDVTNFIHAFRQENGVTPHQFRRHGVLTPPMPAVTAVGE